MSIRCTYYKPRQDDSQVIADCGFEITTMGLYFSNCKEIRTKNGGIFYAGPSRKYVNSETGREEYGQYWWFNKEWSKKFQEAARSACEAFKKEKGVSVSQGTPQPKASQESDYASVSRGESPLPQQDDDELPF